MKRSILFCGSSHIERSMYTLDRERMQQWVIESSRARPGNVSTQRKKPPTRESVKLSGTAKQGSYETSKIAPQEMSMQNKPAWHIDINTFIFQAESVFNVARDTCAALIPLEQITKTSKPTPSTCSPFQPNIATIFSQYEKSRRAKLLLADEASHLSTAPAFSDFHSQSMHISSRVAASHRTKPASSASRHG
jgi:hypothetical protein